MTQKPNFQSTLQRVLAEFDERFGALDEMSPYAARTFLKSAITESLKEAFAALDLETPENFKEVSIIYIKGWNAALQAIEEKRKAYFDGK